MNISKRMNYVAMIILITVSILIIAMSQALW